MEYVVARPFKTVNRRFGIGDRVMAHEIDGHEEWAERGFLTDPSRPVERPTMKLKSSRPADPS